MYVVTEKNKSNATNYFSKTSQAPTQTGHKNLADAILHQGLPICGVNAWRVTSDTYGNKYKFQSKPMSKEAVYKQVSMEPKDNLVQLVNNSVCLGPYKITPDSDCTWLEDCQAMISSHNCLRCTCGFGIDDSVAVRCSQGVNCSINVYYSHHIMASANISNSHRVIFSLDIQNSNNIIFNKKVSDDDFNVFLDDYQHLGIEDLRKSHPTLWDEELFKTLKFTWRLI